MRYHLLDLWREYGCLGVRSGLAFFIGYPGRQFAGAKHFGILRCHPVVTRPAKRNCATLGVLDANTLGAALP